MKINELVSKIRLCSSMIVFIALGEVVIEYVVDRVISFIFITIFMFIKKYKRILNESYY